MHISSLKPALLVLFLSRFFAKRCKEINPDSVPPHPAGFPTKEEIEESQIKTGPPFWTILPLIPIFNENKDGDFDLIDPRKIKNVEGMKVNVVFRLKQSYVSFSSKENTLQRVERITIDPAIIAVVILAESLEKGLSPVEVFKRRRISSFNFSFALLDFILYLMCVNKQCCSL